MPAPTPTLRTLLDSLPSRARLIELARYFGVFVPQKGTKAELCAAAWRRGGTREAVALPMRIRGRNDEGDPAPT